MRGNVGSVTVSRPHEMQRHEMQRPGSPWLKSSISYANGNCVEVASLPGGEIGVRNSRDSAGPVLKFTSEEWLAFLIGVRNGGSTASPGKHRVRRLTGAADGKGTGGLSGAARVLRFSVCP
jgi:uncharacterized protein DUF397